MIAQPSKSVSKNREPILQSPLSFWKQQIVSVSNPILEIPTDFPRTAKSSYQPAYHSILLSSGSHSVEKLAEHLEGTPFTIFLSVFSILLFRYTSQKDIIIGHPISEATIDEKGEEIGKFCKTKIFRIDLSGNPGFQSLLKQVTEICLIFNQYKEVEYEILEETIKAELGSGYISLYNTTFSFIDKTEQEIQNSGLRDGNKYQNPLSVDLGLRIEKTLEGFKCNWTYNASLFAAGTMQRMTKHFEILLGSIIEKPQQPISDLSLLSWQEEHQLLNEWNSCKVDYPEDKCVHQLFEEQATKTPKAIALVFEKTKMTYEGLNERSNQLAYYLKSEGAKAEMLVPICFERGVEMIVSILAILKIGAVYVPIDPDYPFERITYIVEDTQATLIICNEETSLRFYEHQRVKCVVLNSSCSLIKGQPKTNIPNTRSSNSLAYIIYTSGSTGNPKGVMIEHKSLVDHCYGVIDKAHLKSCKSFALFSPLVFDAGHSIIHSCFLLGASLHVLSKDLILNGLRLKDYFNNHSIDCIKIVPSLWLSYATEENQVTSKKVMIFGGESFSLSILEYLVKLNYKGEVYNHYGPTEVTIGKCIHKVDLRRHYINVPVGKPFSNSKVFIVDENFQLVPVGVRGELYIAGKGLARGYLNMPGLTAEKFISNPFDNSDGFNRIYKTGDKVRWLADGNIEFLGRTDEQVKINGHRIELKEIEQALFKFPGVENIAVAARESKPGEKHLVGYIVMNNTSNPSRSCLQSFLRGKLPDYMIPGAFVFLSALPLTINGKIDHKALPIPAWHKTEENNMSGAPRDLAEVKLSKIFEDCLQVKGVSIKDDFFEMGGDSLHAAVMFTKIAKTFNKHLPLSILIEAPTVEQLAFFLRDKKGVSHSSLVPIQIHGSKSPLFCVHGGLGNILLYRNLSKYLGPDQPLYGLQAKGLDGKDEPYVSLEEMAAHYIKEIRSVQPNGPYYLAGYCFGAKAIFEMARQLMQNGEDVALLANFNGITPYYGNPSPLQFQNQHQEVAQGANLFSAKLSYHLNTIRDWSLREKLAYPFKRLKYNLKQRFKKLSFLLSFWISYLLFSGGMAVLKVYKKMKLTPPASLVRQFVVQTINDSARRYKLKPIPKKMVIFRSPLIYRDPTLGWSKFLNELETYDIPGNHANRQVIMDEPFVRIIAEKLKKHLPQIV